MTPERLDQIRAAYAKCPAVWDQLGRPILKPAQVALYGAAAITHRAELLTYVDELVGQLNVPPDATP